MIKRTVKENLVIAIGIGVVLAFFALGFFLNPFSAGHVSLQPTDSELFQTETGASESFAQGDVEVVVLREGSGDSAQVGDTLEVHYRGYFESGEVFDSSYENDNPLVFTLGTRQVIEGWERGIIGMRVGERRVLSIPSDLAYGPLGITAPDGRVIIPPNSPLIFEVELLDIR
jgi:FKBP-type peptidyl-prolyl cis-trans isomerase